MRWSGGGCRSRAAGRGTILTAKNNPDLQELRRSAQTGWQNQPVMLMIKAGTCRIRTVRRATAADQQQRVTEEVRVSQRRAFQQVLSTNDLPSPLQKAETWRSQRGLRRVSRGTRWPRWSECYFRACLLWRCSSSGEQAESIRSDQEPEALKMTRRCVWSRCGAVILKDGGFKWAGFMAQGSDDLFIFSFVSPSWFSCDSSVESSDSDRIPPHTHFPPGGSFMFFDLMFLCVLCEQTEGRRWG